MAPRSVRARCSRQLGGLYGTVVRWRRPSPSGSSGQVVKINMPGEQQHPAAMNSSPAVRRRWTSYRLRFRGVCSDVVAALNHLAEMVDQWLKFGPFSDEQRFAVEFRAFLDISSSIEQTFDRGHTRSGSAISAGFGHVRGR
jgi:hypothetical protein